MKKGKLLEALKSFTGTQQYFFHPLFKAFKYTDGVRFLAKNAGCYWLLELIFSHQTFAAIKGEEFQKWTLQKKEDACTVTVSDGNGNHIKTIEISFTDFPLQEFNLWFCDGVLLLPNEY